MVPEIPGKHKKIGILLYLYITKALKCTKCFKHNNRVLYIIKSQPNWSSSVHWFATPVSIKYKYINLPLLLHCLSEDQLASPDKSLSILATPVWSVRLFSVCYKQWWRYTFDNNYNLWPAFYAVLANNLPMNTIALYTQINVLYTKVLVQKE